jgi:hypothetical protein
VLPAELWDGEVGNLLRSLQRSPDDKSNLVSKRHAQRARLDEGREGLAMRAKRANDEVAILLPGGAVKPFFLLPDACWNGDLGDFLMLRLYLYPYDEWHVAFLPIDERTAYALNAPPHPGREVPAFVDLATGFLRRERANLSAAHELAIRTRDFARFTKARDEVCARVRGLAGLFRLELDKTWSRHRGAAS